VAYVPFLDEKPEKRRIRLVGDFLPVMQTGRIYERNLTHTDDADFRFISHTFHDAVELIIGAENICSNINEAVEKAKAAVQD